MPEIHVFMLDIDGAVLNNQLLAAWSESPVEALSIDDIKKLIIEKNKQLIDFILQQKSDKRIIMVGSNRQSFSTNYRDFQTPVTGYFILETIANAVGTSLDTFLLTDLYNGLPYGTTYKTITEPVATGLDIAQGIEHPTFVCDNSKVALLYPQIHKMADQYQEESDHITFHFFDDRQSEILDQVDQNFGVYPSLIPKNCILNLYHYNGELTSTPRTLQGAGERNPRYVKSTKLLISFAADPELPVRHYGSQTVDHKVEGILARGKSIERPYLNPKIANLIQDPGSSEVRTPQPGSPASEGCSVSVVAPQLSLNSAGGGLFARRHSKRPPSMSGTVPKLTIGIVPHTRDSACSFGAGISSPSPSRGGGFS